MLPPDSGQSAAFQPAERFGRYTILDRTDDRAFDDVWTAYDPRLNRKIVLKLVHPNMMVAGSAQVREREKREARVLAKLSHPNVVSVYEIGELDETLYVAMEFVHGETVERWIETTSPEWEEVLRVYLAAGEGLAAAHGEGIVHRNIDSTSLIVGRGGVVKVVGFGFAGAAVANRAHPMLGRRRDAAAVEEKRSPESIDTIVDIQAWAALLHESLYGRQFGRTHNALRSPEIRSSHHRSYSRIRWILQSAIQQGSGDEYPSMNALLTSLKKALHRTNNRGVGAAVIGAIVLGSVGAWSMIGPESEPEESPCLGAAEIWADVWTLPMREAIRRRFVESELPGAIDAIDDVEDRIDRFGDAWTTTWTGVCEATRVDKVQPQVLLDTRMDCLTEQRQRLEAVIERLASADERAIERSTTLLASLDAPSFCAVRGQGNGLLRHDDPKTEEGWRLIKKAEVSRSLGTRPGEIIDLTEDAERIGRRFGETALRAAALHVRSEALYGEDNINEARKAASEAIRLAAESGDLHEEWWAWMMFVWTRKDVDSKSGLRLGQGLFTALRLIQNKVVKEAIASPLDLEYALFMEATLESRQGRFQAAKRVSERLVDGAEPYSKTWELGLLKIATVSKLQGDNLAAEKAISGVLRSSLIRAGRKEGRVARHLFHLSSVYRDVGETRLATALLSKALDLVVESYDSESRIVNLMRTLFIGVLLDGGDVEGAARVLDDLQKTSVHEGDLVRIGTHGLACEVLREQGHAHEALRECEFAFNEMIEAFEDSPNTLETGITMGICQATALIDRLEALKKCDDAERAIGRLALNPRQNTLLLHQVRHQIYKDLGRTAEAMREQVVVDAIEAYFAGVRSLLKGPPDLGDYGLSRSELRELLRDSGQG